LPNLLKKLYKLSIWNSGAAGLNFISNILIAKLLGTAIFGDLFYLGSLVGIFTLILIIVPPNYSLIKYQDDPTYKYLLGSFYIFAWTLMIIPVWVFKSWVDLPFYLFYLYTFSFSLQSYFDIKFQAENKLNRYYAMLFIQALVKITLIILAFYTKYLTGFTQIVMIITASQLVISLLYLLTGPKIFLHSWVYFMRMLRMIVGKRRLFSSYYLNIGLKKIAGNLIVLLFEPFVSRDVLGIYALLIKVMQFIQGLIRTLESIFLVKENRADFSKGFFKNALILGLILQSFHILIGVVYMQYIEGKPYLGYLLLMSFIHYFYIFFVKARAYFISRYRNAPINWSYLLFLLPILFLFLIKSLSNGEARIQELVGLYTLASIIQMTYLILAEKKLLNEKADQ
jgi:hypothetical protein